MTSKIFTTNVFLTTSKKLIDRLFSTSYVSNFEQGIVSLTPAERDISLIVHPGKNNNFIELSYEFGSQLQADQSFLTLKFLETNTLFETYFLQDSLENIYQRVKTDGMYSSNKKIYFSFGVGNDLRNWAGPFECSLLKSSFIITEAGTRLITLNFVPIGGSILRNYYAIVSKPEARINSTNAFKQNHITSVKESFKIKDIFKPNFIDELFTRLVKNYLKQISNNSEVLVMLPSVERELFEVQRVLQKYNKPIIECFRFLGVTQAYDFVSDNFDDYPNSMFEVVPDKVIEADEATIELTTNRPRNNQRSAVPDPWEPISDVVNSLNQLFTSPDKSLVWAKPKTVGFMQCLIVENNLQIKKLWKDSGIIQDDKKNIIIFGDSRIIAEVLYPDNTNPERNDYALTDAISNIRYGTSKFREEYKKYLYSRSSSLTDFYSDAKSRPIFGGSTEYVPIFRFNKENSNVLSINFASNPSYMSFFASEDGILRRGEADVYVNVRDLIKQVEEIEELDKKLQKTNISLKEIETITNQKNVVINKIYELYNITGGVKDYKATQATLEKLVKNSNGLPMGGQLIEFLSNVGAEVVAKEIFDILERMVTNLAIKTLPAFTLTNLGSLGSLIYIDANDGKVLTAKKKESSSFLSGFYRVQGYKHVVTTREAYSEFTLVKDHGGIYPEIDPETGRITTAGQVSKDIKKP